MAEIVSQRGKKKLVHENHAYVFSKRTRNDEHGIWVCEKRGTCRGRVWTAGFDGPVVKVVTIHNHPADATRPEALRIVGQMRERATRTLEPPQQVITAVVDQVHANVAAKLPSISSMKRTIQRTRVNNGAPALPMTVEELVIPQEYKEIIIDGNVQQFLMYDSENELPNGRMLIFSTNQNLHLLAQSREWFSDGTFSTAPHLFNQLNTIHVIVHQSVVPVVYALLPDKSRQTYIKMLQELKNLQLGLLPQLLMTDFEQTAMQAFNFEFPGIMKTGCFFHLTQSVWRRVQREGLQAQYENDHEFAQWIRMIPALAFVPPADVAGAFEELTEHEDFPDQALNVISYFENTYIGAMQRRGRRRAPLFPVEIWNVYQRTLDRQQRTNNDVEGWHRGFVTTCGTDFPNIFRFISSLKRQQALHNLEITQMIAGRRRNPPNGRYAALDTRLHGIVADYANRNVIDYLRGIAYQFQFYHEERDARND